MRHSLSEREAESSFLLKHIFCIMTSYELEKGTASLELSVAFADGQYCSHDIKRQLLLGRKAMTDLDSILKSRDITLPTKVHLVKAMVFPVVMYGCESWTIKKAER